MKTDIHNKDFTVRLTVEERLGGTLQSLGAGTTSALCVLVQNLASYMTHLLRSAVILLNVNGVAISDWGFWRPVDVLVEMRAVNISLWYSWFNWIYFPLIFDRFFFCFSLLDFFFLTSTYFCFVCLVMFCFVLTTTHSSSWFHQLLECEVCGVESWIQVFLQYFQGFFSIPLNACMYSKTYSRHSQSEKESLAKMPDLGRLIIPSN